MDSDNVAFHEGECAVQARVGVRERLAELGSRVIRDHMPEQHREFFSQLPFLIVGTVDDDDQPWASILASPPGFIESPSPIEMIVRAHPPAFSPLHETLQPGNPVAFLGIEPHTRRRNRMNGVIRHIEDEYFSVDVRQSFGNCPKYIQPRNLEYLGDHGECEQIAFRSERLNDVAREMILGADTFFIASAYPVGKQLSGSAYGVDVSHRGGPAGFVHVSSDGSLTVPDFVGNFFFNTLGNITVNPRAGLLFFDFEKGHLLYVAVTAEIIWEGAEVDSYDGAERLLRFHVREMRFVENSLSLRWRP